MNSSLSLPFLVFGEALWDLFPDGMKLGGAPLNFAYYFKKAGANPMLISAVGRDKKGQEALQAIRHLGLETCHIQTNERPTGTVAVELQGRSHRFKPAENTAWEYIQYPEDTDLIQKASGLYFGTLSRVSVHNRQVLDMLLKKSKDRSRFMDINMRKRFWTRDDILFLLQQTDYLKMNHYEAGVLKQLGLINGWRIEALAQDLLRRYPLKACCITLGKQGAVAADMHSTVRVAGIPARPGGDAVGAGDAFGAFFLAGLLKGWPLLQAVQKANQIGSRVASCRGAIADFE